MKAIIFAAGLGTRLRPVTADRPKALVEVNGVTMLERTLRAIIAAGCTSVVVNVHHFADKVIDFLNSHDWGVEVHVSDERDLLLETGGGVLAARQWLDGDEPFIVHNADILTNGLNLKDMADYHKRSGALATLLVRERDTVRHLLFDTNYRMHGWINLNTGELRPEGLNEMGLMRRAFGGIHICSPEIFPALEQYAHTAGRVFSTVSFYIDACRDHLINGYYPAGDYLWLDVGKPDTLKQANEVWATLEGHSNC